MISLEELFIMSVTVTDIHRISDLRNKSYCLTKRCQRLCVVISFVVTKREVLCSNCGVCAIVIVWNLI